MTPKFLPPPYIPIAQVHGFDRIAVAIDCAAVSGPVAKLEASCRGGMTVIQRRLKFNPQWKATVELYQPSAKALRLLVNDCLAEHVGALPTYAEVAVDFIFRSHRQAAVFGDYLAQRIVMRHQRQTVHVEDNTTIYFARRADVAGNKRGRVGCMYFDRPSKLASAHQGQPCVHVEIRLTGSAALSAVGIASASDFLTFDHLQFWASAISLYDLPSKTELGRHIGGRDDSGVSGTALRKRAEKFIRKASVDGQFFMHNAARLDRAVVRKFWQIPLKTVMPPAQATSGD